MAIPRRAALQTLRRFTRQQPRRYASHGSHGGATEVKESFGTSLYIILAVFPTAFITYKLSRGTGDDEPVLTRFIKKYDSWLETYQRRNTLHTKMVEQAGMDRLLFIHHKSGPDTSRGVDLKNQEMFMNVSPYNVPAGQGSINLDKVIAHLEQSNVEHELERIERTKRQTVVDHNIPGK